MTHYACFVDPQGRQRQMALPAPAGNYGVGHLVSSSNGRDKFKLVGEPHHQPTKGNPAVCDAFWPAETVDHIDPLLTREKD